MSLPHFGRNDRILGERRLAQFLSAAGYLVTYNYLHFVERPEPDACMGKLEGWRARTAIEWAERRLTKLTVNRIKRYF